MELKVLGSVSPYPKEKSNCPGYLIKDNNSRILLDCGNGCISNFNLEEDLKNLIIIISHLHNDHYGDLLVMAYTSYVYHELGLFDDKIKVYLPYPKTKEEQIAFDYLLSFKESFLDYVPYDDNTVINHGKFNISFRKSTHNITTYYAKIKTNNYNFVYSADTGYSDDLIDFCKNADMFLCESTFARFHNKKSKYHLNSFDAGILAGRANVERLILTHFWPEVDRKICVLEAKDAFFNTEAAEEGKVFRLSKDYKNYK